jgi:hypothetical protein
VRRWAIIIMLLVGVAWPRWGHAQCSAYDTSEEKYDEDHLNPCEYQDIEDAQLLKFASYLMTPIGMGLEWGITRPLHYVATQTLLAPLLTGDKDFKQFGQNNNADLLPPETFARPPLNFSNTFVPSPPERPLTSRLVEEPVAPSIPTGSQPALR